MLRPMLAGMLSVLLVAGLIAAGVWALTDHPEAAPARTPDRSLAQAPEPTASPEPAATASPEPTGTPAPLPKVRQKRLQAAVKAAGCTLEHPPLEGVEHDVKEFTAADYGSNPPTSGTHSPEWYADGVYAPGTTEHLGQLVHALEHGRIEVQYRAGTDAGTVARFERLLDELDGGYHMLLFQNATDMPYAVAATAWGHLLGCADMNERVFDALRAFRNAYIDKGPEIVP